MESFSKYPVYNLFHDKLDYLKTNRRNSANAENLAVLKAQKAEKLAQELSELDKEMSKIIGQDLESRKMDRLQPHSSDVYLPLFGLLQKSSSPGSMPSILLKKKKKSVLKTLNK